MMGPEWPYREFQRGKFSECQLLGRRALTRVVAGAKNFRSAAFDFGVSECQCKWVRNDFLMKSARASR
ncbi:hypothetical protein Nepgr_015814 [Nepenthes gracilis]|uniref:Uncharacterized protein n=1 Tax=Nepenthes gracilis TaxID=150966 RepID=A0AAD3SME6_NEPGR|nr:hypothetical protein Nepgr_015814 [Nepenthes gracilis]